MIYQLRDYQQQASNAAVRFFHDTKSKKNAVMARPTMSLALYYQIVGRCIRPHPKKESAWLVDLCGNVRPLRTGGGLEARGRRARQLGRVVAGRATYERVSIKVISRNKKIHMRSSFVFYGSWWEAIKNLPRDVQGDVLTAIIEYGLTGETTEQLKPIAKAMLVMVKPQIDADNIFIERHQQRNCNQYKQWRKDVFNRDKYTCQYCGKIGGKLNAHHIKPFSIYPELRFDVDNGITLCKKCHIELHKIEREWEKK